MSNRAMIETMTPMVKQQRKKKTPFRPPPPPPPREEEEEEVNDVNDDLAIPLLSVILSIVYTYRF